MASLNDSETEPQQLVQCPINQSVRNQRTEFVENRAISFILACTLLERIAFYALVNTLFTTLRWYKPFLWRNVHSQTASFIFSGK